MVKGVHGKFKNMAINTKASQDDAQTYEQGVTIESEENRSVWSLDMGGGDLTSQTKGTGGLTTRSSNGGDSSP